MQTLNHLWHFLVVSLFIFHRRHLSDKIVADTHSYSGVTFGIKESLKCCFESSKVKSFFSVTHQSRTIRWFWYFAFPTVHRNAEFMASKVLYFLLRSQAIILEVKLLYLTFFIILTGFSFQKFCPKEKYFQNA